MTRDEPMVRPARTDEWQVVARRQGGGRRLGPVGHAAPSVGYADGWAANLEDLRDGQLYDMFTRLETLGTAIT